MFEKDLNIRHGQGLFQEIFVEKRTVYGIDALRAGPINKVHGYGGFILLRSGRAGRKY